MMADEPGTLRIELLTPIDHADRVIVWDVYENMEAVEAHRTGELLRKFICEAGDILLSVTGVRHLCIE